MPRNLFRILGLVLFVAVAAPGWCAARAGHVVIISLDGGKPAVMQQSAMPNTMQLVKEGAGTWGAQTIFPSITLPSHTSMLTGVGPAKHQVDWNSYEPTKSIKVPTIFSQAKAAGHTTAAFPGKEKFKHFDRPGEIDKFEIPSSKAIEIAAAAGKYIAEKKPEMLFIHFPDSDSAGHKHGWGSPEQIAAFGDEDTALKTVMDALKGTGIAQDTVLIVSADHGGHDKTHGSNSPEDMTIPWLVWGKGVKPGFTITAPVTTYDTAATALWLLDVAIPAEWDGKPVTSAFVDGDK